MLIRLRTFLDQYKYHFLVWSIFIAYEVMMQRMIGTRLSSLKECIIAYSTGASIFYFHAHILLKYTLNTKNKLLRYCLPLFILLELACYIELRYLIEEHLYKYIGVHDFALNESFKLYITPKIWRCFYFIGTSTVYYFSIRDFKQNRQIEKLRQQELKAILLEKEIKNELILTQNALLRAQINPHFLINTLSYLYNETRKSAPKAADSILLLSDIMQYTLSKEVSSGFVKLENEIKLVESFLILQQASQTYKTQLKLSYNSEVSSVYFIPMILMSLTENMIKHDQFDIALKPAEINISYENSILYIKTSNYESSNGKFISHGLRLKNIRDRLTMAYGETATFDYHFDSQNYFHTRIKVQF
jgi:two-component system LytT family sensor kinase